MDIFSQEFLDYVEEYEKKIDYDALGKAMLANADRQVRTEYERYRHKVQLNDISHNDIRDYVAKNLSVLFNLKLISIESKLIKGRIDILGVDKDGNHVGIEIKKAANYNERNQFQRYYEEIHEKYGSGSRLIVLASRYKPALLEIHLNNIEYWRYEIWWKLSKKKNEKNKPVIDILRVTRLEDDGGIYNSLIEDKISSVRRNSRN